MKELTEKEAFERISSYCASSEHCVSEVNSKLERWGVPKDWIERIDRKLIEEKYIDEERFCQAFVNDRFRFSKWGKRKIAQDLYLKGIPSETIHRCLESLNQEEYEECLRKLILAKLPSVKAKNNYELRGKLIRFAAGRGFEIDEICRCLEVPEDDIGID